MSKVGDSKISPATLGDIVELSQNMREADRLEVLASTGKGPFLAAYESFNLSKESWALRIDGDLICVYGVAPLHEDTLLVSDTSGIVWMLATEAIGRHKKAFLKLSKEVFPTLFERWGTLVNAVDVRHEKALRWGKRMGFVFGPSRLFGEEGLLFKPFTVTLEDHRCAQ